MQDVKGIAPLLREIEDSYVIVGVIFCNSLFLDWNSLCSFLILYVIHEISRKIKRPISQNYFESLIL